MIKEEQTKIVKNDSDNEDLVDAKKVDVTNGSECEEDEQEQNVNLELIKNTHNSNKEKFTCPVCEKEFRHRYYYRAHFKSHKYGKQFKCEKCDSAFNMKTQLHTHKKFKCKYVSTKVACPECGKEFRNPSNLKYHMVLHEQPERVGMHNMKYSDEIKQEALELLKKYSKAETARKLKVTYSAITNWYTSSKKSFNCNLCGKRLSDNTRLRRHEKSTCPSLTSNIERKYKYKVQVKSIKYEDKYKYEDGKYTCTNCNLRTHSLNNLKEHIESKHEGVKYACNQCDKQFSYRSGLREHKNYEHLGIVHSCPVCGKKTVKKSDLKRHMRKHQPKQEDPYVKQEEPYRRRSEKMFNSS